MAARAAQAAASLMGRRRLSRDAVHAPVGPPKGAITNTVVSSLYEYVKIAALAEGMIALISPSSQGSDIQLHAYRNALQRDR